MFPPSLRVDNLKNFNIKSDNIISFKKVSLEIPFQSPFSDKFETNLSIHKPRIHLNDDIFKKKEDKKESKPLEIPFDFNRINIIDGELLFQGRKLFCNIVDFDLQSLSVSSGKTMYRINTPHVKVIFPLSGGNVKLEGAMTCEFKMLRTSYKISDFTWNTEDLRINMRGRVFKNGTIAINAAVKGNPDKILYPVLKKLRPLGYMDINAKIRRRRKEAIFVEGEVVGNKFTIDNHPFENLTGTVKWDSNDKEVRADLNFEDGIAKPHLKVFSVPTLTRVEGENVGAEKLTRVIDIHEHVPLGSIVSNASVKIRKGIISGTGRLDRADVTAPETFNLSGELQFVYNSNKKSVHFVADQVRNEFGTIDHLVGFTDPTQETSFEINAYGNIDQMGQVDKYTNYYIDLDFSQWKLAGGQGTLALDVKKTGDYFYADSDIAVRNFTTSGQPIALLTGRIKTKRNQTIARFEVVDPQLKGKAKLVTQTDHFTTDFWDVEGEIQKMMKVLEIQLDLSGWGQGRFNLLKRSNSPLVHIAGKFTAKQINFYDYIFDNVESQLEYSDSIHLRNLKAEYNDGKGSADIFIDYENEMFRISGQVLGIDVHRLNPEFKGRGDVFFNGGGGFWQSPISIDYTSGDLYFYADRKFRVKGTGSVFTDFTDFRIDVKGDIMGEADPFPFTLTFNSIKERNYGNFHLEPTDINLLIPWGDNTGTISLDGSISGAAGEEITSEGHAILEGKVLSFPNFPHALEDFKGDITFRDLNFELRSLTGKLGGGNVESHGRLSVVDNHLHDLFISFEGKSMNLYLMDRTSFTVNAGLNLKIKKENQNLLLSGNIDVLQGIWERDIDEGVSFNTDPDLSDTGSKLLDRLEFDLKLSSQDNIQLKNSLGKATGKFDFHFQGTREFPIFLGSVDCREGEIYFSDKKFDLIKGRLVFNDRFQIDPIINFESESFIKDYRISFNIKGRSSLVKPELRSSPPLPHRDILTLITLGELFERPSSDELTSRVDSGTTGLIASQLTQQIKKRTRKIFGNYMLKIDPNISNIAGASFEESSRLIVGKEIAKDFLVVYSTNFSTQDQKQVIYLQYQLSPAISLIGMLNEEGRYSLDLRFRKRK